jgi:integrase
MPRLTKKLPRLCKHSDGHHAIVRLNDRVVYLGRYGTKASKQAYDRVTGEWLASGRRIADTTDDIAIVEMLAQFVTFAKAHYRRPDGTATSEFRNIADAVGPLTRMYGDTAAASFGPLKLRAVRDEMIRLGWARTHINRQISRLRHVFKWAAGRELIPSSVYHGLQAVEGLQHGRCDARESDRVRPVDGAIVDATLEHLSSVTAAMVQTQRLTGARAGEIVTMKTGEIDTSGTTWIYRPAAHKTAHHGNLRQIFIGPHAQAILRPFLTPLNPMACVFRPADAVAERIERLSAARKTPLNQGNRPGSNRVRRPKRRPNDRYSVASYRKAIQRAADLADAWAKAGQVIANDERVVPRWHPHQLRHTAATEIRRRFGIEAAQTILGHATLNMTELYAEKNAEAGQRIAAAIG